MRLWTKIVFLLASAIFLGCNPQPKVPDTLKTDPKLKAIARLDVMPDRSAIGLEWEGLDDYNIAGYLIYRAAPNAKLTRIGATANRFSNHYIDDDIEQDRQYIYSVSYYTKDGRESRQFVIPASTLPLPEPVSWVSSGNILPRKAKIIFRPHSNERINGYIIERRDKKQTTWRVVGKLEGRLHAEYIDENLDDGAEYEYRIIAVSFDDLKSRPSEIVITATKPLPPQVTGLSASTGLRGKIELKWRRVKDDAGGTYRIYASNSADGGFSQIAELTANLATETINADGAERFYKITFVDYDGLESPLSAKAVRGATLPPPKNAQK
ncbi:MAG: hypothetical protein LBP89_02300 [Helicobacteraceae bacterium]|jgi:fibronectin type 3 domain-containing protein|nr:hypothetical protein [Helicobacteraceae bacterium]